MVFLTRRLAIVLLVIAGAAGMAGCAHPRQTPPSVDPNTLSDDGFNYYLAAAPIVTVDEAYRAIVILADGEDTAKTFAARQQLLFERGIARPEWNLQANNIIDQGAVAAMICNVMRIRGGFNRFLFKPIHLGDRRYANRELIYRELLPAAPDYAGVQGGVLLAAVTKADAYMAANGLYQAKVLKLGSEQEAVEEIHAKEKTSPARPAQ